MRTPLQQFFPFQSSQIRTTLTLLCFLSISSIFAFQNNSCFDNSDNITIIDMGVHNESNYFFYQPQRGFTWQAAKSYCENNGGHLAIINDAEENEFLRSNSPKHAWIGYSFNENAATFQWVDGTTGNYINWHTSETNSNHQKNYVLLSKATGKWSTKRNRFKASFIMEVPLEVIIDNDEDGIASTEDCNDDDPNLPAPIGSACNDNNDYTTEDVILADGCTCEGTIIVIDIDQDGIPAEQDCDDNNPNIPADAGTACDDGNDDTENDVILNDGCTCEGTIIVIDVDQDGIPAEQDCDDNNPNIPADAGTACDDGNDDTENDVILNDGCTCEGTIIVIDIDQDGIPAEQDCDDNNPNIPAEAGTTCDDGNDDTENDVILTDGCTCEGEVVNSECDLSYTLAPGAITVNSLTDPNVDVLVFDADFNIVFECGAWVTNCQETQLIDLLAPGAYFLQIQTYNYNMDPLCEMFEQFTITEDTNSVVDVDEDGVAAEDDCDDNDPTIPAAPGTSCDDNNDNTNNDLILADGCTCEGTIVVPSQCGIEIISNNGTLSINNLTAPNIDLLIFDESFNIVYECSAWGVTCTETELIDFLAPGSYFIQIQTYNIYMDPVCGLFEPFSITSQANFMQANNNDQTTDSDFQKSFNTDANVDNFSVFPNPTSDRLTVDLTKYIGLNGTIEITNGFGHIKNQFELGQINNEFFQIDVNDYKGGVYSLTIKVSNRRINTKMFVVSKL